MAETLDNLDDALFGDFEDYLAGTLPEARRREVDARLKASPEARALLAEFTEAQTLFQTPVWDVPEPAALPSAQAILDRAKSRPTARKSFLAGMKDWFGVAMWRPALASGFAIALLASGTWLVFRSNQSQKTESVADGKSRQDPAGNTPIFNGSQPIAAPASNASTPPATPPAGDVNTAGKTVDSRDGKLDANEKRDEAPTNAPVMKPANPEPEKAGDTRDDGVIADNERASRDRAPESKPEAPKTAPPPPPVSVGSTGMGGGVPAQPSPAPKAPATTTTEEARGGEKGKAEDTDNNLSASRAAEPKKKMNSRGAPGANTAGPRDQSQMRRAEPAPARRQAVSLTVANRDPAISQLKSIAGQFGGTISVNGSSIEIVVPGDKVDACAARVRAINQSELKKERDRAPKDTDTKKEPEPAVRLTVTVKEKPE